MRGFFPYFFQFEQIQVRENEIPELTALEEGAPCRVKVSIIHHLCTPLMVSRVA
jgi:hypothetical protein